MDGEKRVKLWIKGKRRIRARGGGSNGETSVIMVTALSPFKFTRKKHVELFSFFFFFLHRFCFNSIFQRRNDSIPRDHHRRYRNFPLFH